MIVMKGFIFSGFIMLLPHTINFLMYVYWRARKYPQVKFGMMALSKYPTTSLSSGCFRIT